MSGRILLLDDDPTTRLVLQVKLCAARYDVALAMSVSDAERAVRAGGVDVAIISMSVADGQGAAVCRRLKSNPATSGTPILLATAADDVEARVEGLEAGADDFVTHPVDEIALLARVRALLRSCVEEREFELNGGWLRADGPAAAGGLGARADGPLEGRVALLLDDPAQAEALTDRIAPALVERPVAMDANTALAVHDWDAAPDLFVIDVDLGSHNAGLRLLSELRSRGPTRRAACIVVLPQGDSDRAAMALDLGAADVVHRPLSAREISVRLRTQLGRKKRGDHMRAALEQGLRMAVVDPLTGLYNRRYGLHHLERVALRARTHGMPAGVILMDLDRFKAINDTHGHPTGDRVLSTIAHVLRANVRAEDLVCRLGGEEFLVVLPDAPLRQVGAVAERLRAVVASLPLCSTEGERLSVTMSAGVAALGDDGCERVLERVDRALYRAKAAGRDRVGVDETVG